MNPSEIQAMMLKIFQETDLNTVRLPEEDIDIPILEEPLMAVAAADDPLFAELKKPEAISRRISVSRSVSGSASTSSASRSAMAGVQKRWRSGFNKNTKPSSYNRVIRVIVRLVPRRSWSSASSFWRSPSAPVQSTSPSPKT